MRYVFTFKTTEGEIASAITSKDPRTTARTWPPSCARPGVCWVTTLWDCRHPDTTFENQSKPCHVRNMAYRQKLIHLRAHTRIHVQSNVLMQVTHSISALKCTQRPLPFTCVPLVRYQTWRMLCRECAEMPRLSCSHTPCCTFVPAQYSVQCNPPMSNRTHMLHITRSICHITELRFCM